MTITGLTTKVKRLNGQGVCSVHRVQCPLTSMTNVGEAAIEVAILLRVALDTFAGAYAEFWG